MMVLRFMDMASPGVYRGQRPRRGGPAGRAAYLSSMGLWLIIKLLHAIK
jgi:hypothetical protein